MIFILYKEEFDFPSYQQVFHSGCMCNRCIVDVCGLGDMGPQRQSYFTVDVCAKGVCGLVDV